jgi:hypothetical protein
VGTATWTLGESTGGTGDTLELEAGSYTVAAAEEDYLPASVDAQVPDGGPHTIEVPMALIPGSLLVKALDNKGNVVPDAVWRAVDTDLTNIPAGLPTSWTTVPTWWWSPPAATAR